MSEQLKQVFDDMQANFKPGKIKADRTFYFSLGEGEGQKWSVKIGPDSCEVHLGKKWENADCFLKTSEELFLKTIRGEHKPGMMDFMSGKLKSNNPLLLQELMSCF